jgi:alkanesulfonate monooxygenase SsuD/methylene tetrahydromethanopterin reductase-like flavin-dependent oxidoreductase (luciferase family)
MKSPGLLAFLVTVACGPAFAAEPPGVAPRYVFVPVEAGALRLHTRTGEVWLCAGADGAGACTPLPDQGHAAEVAALERRVAALEARVAALASPDVALSDEEAMDRVMTLAEGMMRRFFGMVRDLKADLEREDL